MKNLTSLLLLLLSVYYLNAQQLSEIDIKITEYPKTFTDVKDLANLINTDFDTDEKKARAIYSWIALNVKYDIKAQFSKKRKKRIKYKNQLDRALKLRKQSLAKINKALHENKATSEGYANLFKELCDLSGLYCYTIKGTGKIRTFDIGKQPRVLNHSWNVVQINKKWFFIDATLGAGTVDYVEKKYLHSFNDKYFFTPPETFFLQHFPKERDWLLVEKSADDFANLPMFYGEFLLSGFELGEPLNGVLDLKGMDSIQFKIKSPEPIEKLTYEFSYEKEASEIKPDILEEEYTFKIPFISKRRGYLTLFYKRKAIISYKISSY